MLHSFRILFAVEFNGKSNYVQWPQRTMCSGQRTMCASGRKELCAAAKENQIKPELLNRGLFSFCHGKAGRREGAARGSIPAYVIHHNSSIKSQKTTTNISAVRAVSVIAMS